MSKYAKLDVAGLRLVQSMVPALQDRITRVLGTEILAEAMSNVPVDTGALKNSGYLETNRDTQRNAAIAEAMGKNPFAIVADAGSELEPGQARVAFAVEYAAHVEFGTENSPAQPFLIPATEAIKAEAEEIAAKVAADFIK